jgi:hypothetical protein
MDSSAIEQLASFLIFLCLVACLVLLAVSPVRWETFKHMVMALAAFGAGVLLTGLLAANVMPSPLLAEVMAVILVSGSVLAGTLAGWFHVRTVKEITEFQ